MPIDMSELASRYKEASKNVDMGKSVSQFAQVGVGLVKKAIQDMHAVDTGTMLNSTTAEKVGDNSYLIGPTVEYAPFVALGTSRVGARPFHIKAANELAKQVEEFGIRPDDLGI